MDDNVGEAARVRENLAPFREALLRCGSIHWRSDRNAYVVRFRVRTQEDRTTQKSFTWGESTETADSIRRQIDGWRKRSPTALAKEQQDVLKAILAQLERASLSTTQRRELRLKIRSHVAAGRPDLALRMARAATSARRRPPGRPRKAALW